MSFGILTIGTDAESFRSGLRSAIERLLGLGGDAPKRPTFKLPGLGETDPVEFMALITPPTAAVVALVTNLMSLWLAGRVVKVSGRLKRPWPDLSTLSFPSSGHALLAAALAATFLPGIAAIIAGVFAASLLMAYALLGLAVMHALTRGISGRGFILGSVYGAIFVFGWPMLLMSLVGLADALLDLRGRVAASRGPAEPADVNGSNQTKPDEWRRIDGSDPARTRRQARPDGRSRAREGRLMRAISCCRRARRCARPTPTASASIR